LPDQVRADKTEAKLRRGGLPYSPAGHRRDVTIGDGSACDGCTETIAPTEKMHKVRLPGDLDLRFHDACYTAWMVFRR
jgi:hypothetical protein